MRRATTATSSNSVLAADTTTATMNSEMRYLEQHVRVLEHAYQEERHQRDVLEKKYARLKRRYIRLERAHAKIVLETHEMLRSGGDTRDQSSLPSPRGSSTECRSPRAERDVRLAMPSRDAYRSPAYATERSLLQQLDRSTPDTDIIDLTSPTARSSAARMRSADVPSPVMYLSSRASRTATRTLSDDDYCAESPGSTPGDDENTAALRRIAPTGASDRAERQQLAFVLDHQRSEATTHARSSVATDDSERALRVRAASARSSSSSNVAARPRPRLGVVDSPDRRLRRAPEQDRDYDLTRRRRRYDASSTGAARPIAAVAVPSPPPSPPSSAASSPTTINSSPRSSPRADDDDDAASLALAQYLQHQENVAAFREYQARAAERERIAAAAAAAADAASHQLAGHSHHEIDPDNMTYDELLRLGEENGDVKKERWRQMAVQVISCLPTHRWTGGSNSDASCIICQYDFVNNDRALTLPCAHVFHEECVDGWIRENNSCPLCKLEIAPM